MATAVSTPGVRVRIKVNSEFRHRVCLGTAWALMLSFVVWTLIAGYPYYKLGMAARVYSPASATFRPSGVVGVRLGTIAVFFFLCIFVYPVRKHWKWLASIGKTKRWLDWHVLFGIAAPLFVTLHSSFKMRGLAGAAYWIMIVVAVSGFIGRYIYAQVPRSVNAAEMTLNDMQALSDELARQLEAESAFSRDEIQAVLALPSRDVVNKLPMLAALWLMIRLDFARPLHVSRLRRKALSPLLKILTLGGFLPSGQAPIERVVSLIRRQSWISTKVLFLKRVRELFHLWHVVHRPFSYSFAALAMTHIVLAVLMGYY